MAKNVKENEVPDCPNHKEKICILSRLKKKISSGLVNSLRSKRDDGLLSCSNFPVTPTPEDLEMDKPVLPETEHLRGKLTDEVEAVLTWSLPKTEHHLMSFLGFANYYRDLIMGYANKVNPMQQLLRHKGKKFTSNNAAEE